MNNLAEPNPRVLATIYKARYWFLFSISVTIFLIYTRQSNAIPYVFDGLPVLGRTLPYTLGSLLMLLAFRHFGGQLSHTGVRLPEKLAVSKALLWILGFGIAVLVARIVMPIVFDFLLNFAGPQSTRQSTRDALAGNLPLLLSLLPVMWGVVFFEEWLLRGIVLNAIAEYLGSKLSS